ncbi:MAG: methyl-accepting chemotaxis protein [Phormidesmis sp.]
MSFLFSLFNQTTPTRRLAKLYAATILTIATLSITGQVITQKALHTQAKDAQLINIAGRQRMLSQKIAKIAYATKALPIAQQRLVRKELADALTLFQQSHEGLQFGSEALSLTHTNSEQVTAMFAEMAADYNAIILAAQSILDTNLVSLDEVANIAAKEGDFLIAMNNIVTQYEQEATARISHLQTTQKILLSLVLLTLLPVLIPLYQVTAQVSNMLSTIQRSGIQVSESSLQIAASGEQIESMATEQATTSAQITASSKEIATIANQLKHEISQVVSEAGQVKESASHGEAEMMAMAEAMTQLEEATQQVDQQLEIIHERAKDIDQVVLAMTKVSDQINLLSLNAAIEAEKAGEAGTGFGVVAREIRRLADKSAIATLEIETLIKEMQAAVGTGVTQMDHFTQHVQKGIGSTAVVTQQLSEVIYSVRALLSPLNHIQQGIVAQSDGAEQIRDAMTQLSSDTEQTVQSLQDNNSALIQLQIAAEGLQEAA